MNTTRNLFSVLLVVLLIAGLSSIAIVAQNQDGSEKSDQESPPAAYVNEEPLEVTVNQLRGSAQQKVSASIRSLFQSSPDFATFLYQSRDLQDTISEKYAKHLLDQRIMEELQRQKAESMGISVSDKKVEETLEERVNQQLQRIISQNQGISSVDDIEKALEKQDRTLKEFKERIRSGLGGKSQIRFSLLQSKLKEEVLEPVAEPTEEEIESYYQENKESYKDDKGNTKPLEEVKNQVKTRLKQKAQQERNNNWQQWLQNLKEKATIEKRL